MDDDPIGTEQLRREHGEQSDGPIPDDGDGLARSDLGGLRGEPAGTEHVGSCQKAGDQVWVGHGRCGDEGAVGEGTRRYSAWQFSAPMGRRSRHELW